MARFRSPTLAEVESSLKCVAQLLEVFSPVINSHLNSFYADSQWETVVPTKIRHEMEATSFDELKERMRKLCEPMDPTEQTGSFSLDKAHLDDLSLEDLIHGIRKVMFRNTRMAMPIDHMIAQLPKQDAADNITPEHRLWDLDHKLMLMSKKKQHEVQYMSTLVAEMAQRGHNDVLKCGSTDGSSSFNVKHLIDVGSGKGYLTSVLTTIHNLKVLAIDSSAINTVGCEIRAGHVKKQLPSLLERTKDPNFSEEGFRRRGKNWKAKEKKIEEEILESTTDNNHNVSPDEIVKVSDVNTSVGTTDDDTQSKSSNDNMKTITLFVREKLEYDKLLSENFGDYASTSKFGLIGLHTCGPLGADSLKIFCSAPNAKVLVNVPCCYHLVNEEYCDSYHKNNLIPDVNDYFTSFPMSTFLDLRQYYLGRNARMLCAHAIERLYQEPVDHVQARSMFYRSILGAILKDKTGYAHAEGNVGRRIGPKNPIFMDYVQKALAKTNSGIQLTNDETQEYHARYCQQADNLYKFVLFRGLFSPLIEEIMLLDRLAFLLEKEEIRDACIVQLFDPKLSPRCYSIVAIKEDNT